MVLFAVPGAFTPTCHKNHLPGFVTNADKIKAKGIDTIAVTGVNDVFVMNAWKKATGADGKIEFSPTAARSSPRRSASTIDLRPRGMGTRSQRYAMVVEDGVVKTLNIEDAPGKADISGAENLLKGHVSLRTRLNCSWPETSASRPGSRPAFVVAARATARPLRPALNRHLTKIRPNSGTRACEQFRSKFQSCCVRVRV